MAIFPLDCSGVSLDRDSAPLLLPLNVAKPLTPARVFAKELLPAAGPNSFGVHEMLPGFDRLGFCITECFLEPWILAHASCLIPPSHPFPQVLAEAGEP